MSYAVFLTLHGCSTPPEAPTELAELAEFLFQHADDEDPAELQAGVLAMRDLMADQDFDAEPLDRAVTLDVLDGESLGGLTIPEGAEASGQVPRGLPRSSTASMADKRRLAREPNRVCIEADTTTWARRTFTEGESCFASGDCDVLRYVQETRRENPLARIWYDMQGFARALVVEPDEGEPFEAIVTRHWIEERGIGDSGTNSFDQLFSVDITYETPDGEVQGWVGNWSEITVTFLSDDAYGNLLVEGLATGGGYGDQFIAGVNPEDYCPNDRNAEKPTRP